LANKDDCKAGLGTNIVEALAKSLEATVVTSNSPQGLKVAISHVGEPAPA
jgi:MinD-like ATPase involved in chromosome partitioning or flagellar assembly